MMQRDASSVERTIQFFRIDAGQNEDGLAIAFDPVPALEAIRQLITTPEWYEMEEDGNALCVLPSPDGTFRYPTARFCRIRRSGLPQLEFMGRISDMDIQENQGLLESIHVVFLPENVIGVEYNHYGPRITRLGNHLFRQSGEAVSRSKIGPIINRNVIEKLERCRELHLLNMEILPSNIQVVQAIHRPLGVALESQAAILGSPKTVSLVLRPERDGEEDFLGRMIGPLTELVRSLPFREGAKQLKVEGRYQRGEPTDPINLLRDDITTKRRMIRMTPRGRALHAEEAFATIIETYDELRSDIEASPSVVPVSKASRDVDWKPL